ncbi:holin [Bacillus sp. AFS073361]|uniref:phage holin n=1 Tax=Bacillus sp. AFS073361 TaxID=2033511 RepID=UPI000BF340EA|nr:phage holin [Bacillus sp. AFS073361]PFP30275.1 holin [Bacillus sp. AFS073361]
MKRFKNYGLWLAVASLGLIVAQAFGLNFAEDKYNEVVNAVLTVLVLAGVVNNPTSGTGFKDK